jgi:hypothetical protein
MDDYGVIKTTGVANAAGTPVTFSYGAAIGNLDLANPRVESRDLGALRKIAPHYPDGNGEIR